MTQIKPPEGSPTWWLDDGADSGVWPCKVIGISLWPGHVTVEGTHPNGPYYGEEITVPRQRVYDGKGNRPEAIR